MQRIKAYLLKSEEWLQEPYIDKIMELLPRERYEKARNLKNPKARAQSVLAYALLAMKLQEDWGTGFMPDILSGSRGKPYLEDYPDIFFNYSHCSRGILCAVSAYETGADIETVKPYKEKLAGRVCHPKELEMLEQIADPDGRAVFFTRIWTAKESYLKYLGCGIDRELRTIDMSGCRNRSFDAYGAGFAMLEGEGFMASVCRSEPSVREDGQGLQEGSTDSRISVQEVSGREILSFCSLSF